MANLSRRKLLKGAAAGAAGLGAATLTGHSPLTASSDSSSVALPSGLTRRGFAPLLAADGVAGSPLPPNVAFVATTDYLTKKPFTDPNVPFPPFPFVRIAQDTVDWRILALDASGKPIGRARWYPWRHQWRWVTDSVSVADYTIR